MADRCMRFASIVHGNHAIDASGAPKAAGCPVVCSQLRLCSFYSRKIDEKKGGSAERRGINTHWNTRTFRRSNKNQRASALIVRSGWISIRFPSRPPLSLALNHSPTHSSTHPPSLITVFPRLMASQSAIFLFAAMMAPPCSSITGLQFR